MDIKSMLPLIFICLQLSPFTYQKEFREKLKRFNVEMMIRNKAKAGMTHHEKNINRLYKEEILDLIKSKEHPHKGSSSFNFLSFIQMKRGPNDKENIQKFFSDQKNFTLETKLDNLPKSAMATNEPWSSTWWPIQNGQTSVRYNKEARMTSIGDYDKPSQDFKKKYTYLESVSSYSQPNDYYAAYKQPLALYLAEINDVWSPSEKYDLLVGDLNFTMTKAEKSHGLKYMENYGNVPAWFGYCHGWTPASYMFKRPNKTVTLTGADGFSKINFLPDDIKGLATAYMANSAYYTNFFGSACNYRKNPVSIDNETGLYDDQECNDIEPGSTILVLGNMLGRLKKNIAFDPDPDFEIWNQPVRGYKLQYFNLMTNKTFDKVNDAKILSDKLDASSPDRFLNFIKKRSPANTHSFIGVFLTIEYVVETDLLHKDDSSNPDALKTVDYVGGVNLDIDNKIIGGEWRYNHHPDFIWRISDAKEPQSSQDQFVKEFNGSLTELRSITQYAIKASQTKIPLRKIIEYLIDKSYVKPTQVPLYPSIIPNHNYHSIGNGNPIKAWANAIYSVRSEDNWIIFTGTAEITRIEPTDSYYKYTDTANGVAYYSACPFVFRMKKYEKRDEETQPENMNKGNNPQIGSKNLVYCEDIYKYTLKGDSIVSLQNPAKGNFFNFVTKQGKIFFSLKPFSVSYGEMPNCDPNDGIPPTTPPSLNNATVIDEDNKSNNNDDENVIINNDSKTTYNTTRTSISITTPRDVIFDDDTDEYLSNNDNDNEDYIDEEDVIYPSIRNNRNIMQGNSEIYSREGLSYVVKMKINGKIYTLKGKSKIQRTKPSGAFYFQSLPNGLSYYSKSYFQMSYDTNDGINTNNNNRNNNRNPSRNNNNGNTNPGPSITTNTRNPINTNPIPIITTSTNTRNPVNTNPIPIITTSINTRNPVNTNPIPIITTPTNTRNPINTNPSPNIATNTRNNSPSVITNSNNPYNTFGYTPNNSAYINNNNRNGGNIGTYYPYTTTTTRTNESRGLYTNPYISVAEGNIPYLDNTNNNNPITTNTNSYNANRNTPFTGTNRNNPYTNTNTNNYIAPSSPYSVSKYVNGYIYTISGSSPITTVQPSGAFHYYDFPDSSRYYSKSSFQVVIQ